MKRGELENKPICNAKCRENPGGETVSIKISNHQYHTLHISEFSYQAYCKIVLLCPSEIRGCHVTHFGQNDVLSVTCVECFKGQSIFHHASFSSALANMKAQTSRLLQLGSLGMDDTQQSFAILSHRELGFAYYQYE